jgi:hypothetical protein
LVARQKIECRPWGRLSAQRSINSTAFRSAMRIFNKEIFVGW